MKNAIATITIALALVGSAFAQTSTIKVSPEFAKAAIRYLVCAK